MATQYAQIQDGLVSATSPVQKDPSWIPFSGKVIAGWSFDGSGFCPPLIQPAAVTSTLEDGLALQAQIALDKSDITVLRFLEKQLPVPTEWISFRSTLRLIKKTRTGVVPVAPAAPGEA